MKNASGDGLQSPYQPPVHMTAAELADWGVIILNLRDKSACAVVYIPGLLNTAMDAHFTPLIGFSIDPMRRKVSQRGQPWPAAFRRGGHPDYPLKLRSLQRDQRQPFSDKVIGTIGKRFHGLGILSQVRRN